MLASAVAGTGKDGHRRKPSGKIFPATPFDPEYRTALGHLLGFYLAEALFGGERQDQPAAFRETVEPSLGGRRRAGIDVNHVRRIERYDGTVTLNDRHIGI